MTSFVWLTLYVFIAHADNHHLPKPHFAVFPIQPLPARLTPAVVQAISTAGSGSGLTEPMDVIPHVAMTWEATIHFANTFRK